ncbi:GHKL domain-containing protein [Mesorhizobium sp. M1C.F.Ca.ET.193.01.1.1]|uniref:MASE4 domain-containing protein n=1 Tax=unclassified Mesorhizobium TaxID=325217 RepID=UPI000FD2F8A8|nr:MULTISPECIES: MASE4 domain-containing protein [unclassified Mesorhizobium]TGQ50085.1 GHKL domain-containing protein [Mesorhizobium sp. M1C.F.Ca.ET.210.01.1.1]TGQ64777.1 GHKL domain-containing protein [Mesorhizobium sp. M1C.F.Ca.ET.212.01.1.1]TGR41029.1 GHKL domain-containing protein [Mesorhizobium sp. M1C.F.Ca.ET.195.01.1.1]TGR60996.1 GHKL domain-containing protein [Mesorhizobium sp. M1C.F.Ca.ET.192.01.1.1]TGR74131.1 GHKL domain-containing protein [Mesorhizobium sp. M1C.F.Ca.ET.189.01.1.1]
MTESGEPVFALASRAEPEVLANVPPTHVQRRTARVFLLALLLILLGTWPFAAIKLPEINAFVPTLAAALFVSDCVTAALLFAQFSILRQWALLAIASGYLFNALVVVAHALTFPGAFTPTGILGSGLQSAVWLYWSWHSGLPLAIIGYALLKDTNRTADVRFTAYAISLSVAGVLALVLGLFWFVTQHEDLLPITFVDVHPLSLFRREIGGVVVLALGGVALWLLWQRQRSLLDQWLVVALCALLLEVALASVLSAGRYNLAWYAGRFYQLVTATVVMVVLLAEMTRLYAGLARSNAMLQQERKRLQRAIDAQRRERDARLITGDAVAATIAHEVNQPLAAMITRAETGLRWLDRAVPELTKARTEFTKIAADGHRAAAVIESIRANFRKDERVRTSFDVDNLIEEVIELLRDDLKTHRILVKVERIARPLRVTGDRIQLQQVLLNLVTNAIEAMITVDGPRDLAVSSGLRDDGRVMISVADTGMGIDERHLQRVFDPLFTTKSRGMGMGLSICRSIIQAHDGLLWVLPNAPRGSVFQIVLASSVGTE